MAFADKQTAIEQYVQANITDSELVFENMASPSPKLFIEWIRCTVQFGDSFRTTLGANPIYRHPGIVFLQIFIKEGIGISRGVELADQLSALFRDQVISGVNCWTPRINKVQNSEAGWFQVQVMVPFYFDEVT